MLYMLNLLAGLGLYNGVVHIYSIVVRVLFIL